MTSQQLGNLPIKIPTSARSESIARLARWSKRIPSVRLALAVASSLSSLACCGPDTAPRDPANEAHASAALTFAQYENLMNQRAQAPHPFCTSQAHFRFDESTLREWYAEEVLKPEEKSVVHVLSSGQWDKHPFATVTNITYCLDNALVGMDLKTQALADMQTAMQRWEGVVNVYFTYVPSEDANCTSSTVVRLKIINNSNITQGAGCSAFPSGNAGGCPAPNDNQSIGLNYSAVYNGSNDPIGLPTHELGHFLGFLHEENHSLHPVAPQCVFEPSWTSSQRADLTTFWDATSVMGPQGCPGATWPGTVSNGDGFGARALYGAPAYWSVSI